MTVYSQQKNLRSKEVLFCVHLRNLLSSLKYETVTVIYMIIVFFFQYCQLHINAHATNLVLKVMVERIVSISFTANISDFISFVYFTLVQ